MSIATKICLNKSYFKENLTTILENDDFKVTLFRYPSGIESVKIANAKGYVELLPYMGQIIWDAEFNGISLRLKNIFKEPKPATCIVDTYGCFAFHSGLLANGCPGPEDTHPMHGEFSCAKWMKHGLRSARTQCRSSASMNIVRASAIITSHSQVSP